MITMSKEMDFFIFLMEGYAANRDISVKVILSQLDELDLTEFVISMFERYHCEAIENAYDDIDQLIMERKQGVR